MCARMKKGNPPLFAHPPPGLLLTPFLPLPVNMRPTAQHGLFTFDEDQATYTLVKSPHAVAFYDCILYPLLFQRRKGE